MMFEELRSALFRPRKTGPSGLAKWLRHQCMAESKGLDDAFANALHVIAVQIYEEIQAISETREAQPQHSRRGAVMKRDKEKGTYSRLFLPAPTATLRETLQIAVRRPEASGWGARSGKHKTRAGFFGWNTDPRSRA